MKKIIFISAIILVLFAGLVILISSLSNNPYNKDKKCVKEYEAGAEGIIGNVDTSNFGEDKAYEIGADQYGKAVFKNPEKAFKQMTKDCAEGLDAIKNEYNLSDISKYDFEEYGVYGWQLTEIENEEIIKQGSFISRFIDIYSNSF